MSTIFNVERFKSALTSGGARSNQFMVMLSFPTFVQAQSIAVARAPFLVNATELPGQTIGPAVSMYRGREVPFAGDRIFEPWTISALNDSEFSIRTALEQWMDGMDNYAQKFGRIQPSEYQRDFEVFQLDRNGKILKSYKMVDAFPIVVSPVSLSFGQNDTISSFTCTFRYQHFIPNDSLSGSFNFANIFI